MRYWLAERLLRFLIWWDPRTLEAYCKAFEEVGNANANDLLELAHGQTPDRLGS